MESERQTDRQVDGQTEAVRHRRRHIGDGKSSYIDKEDGQTEPTRYRRDTTKKERVATSTKKTGRQTNRQTDRQIIGCEWRARDRHTDR